MTEQLNRKTVTGLKTYPERIVQIGGGNFMRAFVDWMIQILNEETDFNSSVVLVRAIPGRYEHIVEQDGLYHAVLRGIQGGELVEEYKLISVINRTIFPYEDFEAFLELARNPDIQLIFSNTTEAGIAFVSTDQQSDTPPSSFPAKLTLFLYARYLHFNGAADKGCFILPVELIENNGKRLKEIVLQYANLWGLEVEFTQWLEEHNVFCTTLVDRIVTGFPKDDAPKIQEKLGFEDNLLAAGEIYHSWIIEAPQRLLEVFPVDKTKTPLHVKIVDDALPYRTIKVRLLNGAHTSMVPIGHLLGFESVREAIEDEDLGRFIKQELDKEIIPSIDDGTPIEELEAFAEHVIERFRNPHIHHLLLAIALNSTSKFKARILPSLVSYHEKTGKIPQRITLALAALIRFYKGEFNGEVISVNDSPDVMEWFKQQWADADSVEALVETVLGNSDLWGMDMNSIEGLSAQVSKYIQKIDDGQLGDVVASLAS